MSAVAAIESPPNDRTARYKDAERALWDYYGIEPKERYVELESPAVRLRIVETGSGEPVLFIPGTAGTGPLWAPLVRELSGYRCLMLDRPGWAFSSSLDYSKHEYKSAVADILRGVVDALNVERAHVVGASIGDVWALRFAERHPDRVRRVVLLGGGPLVSQITVPPFIRLLASPFGAVIVRLPVKPGRIRSIMRNSGHGASLDAGRIPDAFIDWRVALGRYTESMRNERNMVRAIVSSGRFRPGLTLDDSELAGIRQPILFVYGSADPVGTIDLWERVVASLPHAELRLVDGAGHVPWLDDPSTVGASVTRFLGAAPRGGDEDALELQRARHN
jgi:pimeloyl-ACP methyl ester carboxylesterase